MMAASSSLRRAICFASEESGPLYQPSPEISKPSQLAFPLGIQPLLDREAHHNCQGEENVMAKADDAESVEVAGHTVRISSPSKPYFSRAVRRTRRATCAYFFA